MTTVAQVIAVTPSIKTTAERALTDAHRIKHELYLGFDKTYRPDNELDEVLNPEALVIRANAKDVIEGVSASLTRLFDVTATLETANTVAKANVKVDGKVLLSDVPVTYLLFLEKKLNDLKTFVSGLPVNPSDAIWHWDENAVRWFSDTLKTRRTKNVRRNHERAPATDKHPAQVDVYTEDIPVGTWETTKYSGALSVKDKTEYLRRITTLQEAVKFAREEANSMTISNVTAGDAVFGYIFG